MLFQYFLLLDIYSDLLEIDSNKNKKDFRLKSFFDFLLKKCYNIYMINKKIYKKGKW